MEKKLEEAKREFKELEKEVYSVYDMALNAIEKNYKREQQMVKYLMCIIATLLVINGYFAYMFVTTSVVEYTQEGTYNFIDSEGNIISSDISLEEMEQLVELNGKD